MEIQYKNTEKYTPIVIDEILKVEKEKGLTAENLLEEAKDKDNPLHNLFDWNNSSAADKWRVHSARLIINEVKIIVNNREMYAFENITINVSNNQETGTSGTEKVYKPIVEIMNTEEYRKQIISSALESISYWKEKYQEYKELDPIFVSIENVKKKWHKKQ